MLLNRRSLTTTARLRPLPTCRSPNGGFTATSITHLIPVTSFPFRLVKQSPWRSHATKEPPHSSTHPRGATFATRTIPTTHVLALPYLSFTLLALRMSRAVPSPLRISLTRNRLCQPILLSLVSTRLASGRVLQNFAFPPGCHHVLTAGAHVPSSGYIRCASFPLQILRISFNSLY